MGAISHADLRLAGSHAGVEIGADGPSQMALEDLAMIRAVHGSTVLYPADATSTAALVDAMASTPGISYLRTTRGAYPVLYEHGEQFPVGGSKVLRSSDNDQVTLIAAATATAGRLFIAEDHHPEGGLGSAVTDALVSARSGPLSITRLAVDGMPCSGSGEELLAWAGINAASITEAARALTRLHPR